MKSLNKILVTGGAGYIGSITTQELISAGYDVVVFDNLHQGHAEAVPPQATFVRGDLADKAAVKALFDDHPDIDGIMHFASYTLVGESMEKPLLYLRDNLVNAANLLEEATARGVRRFILSSTANLFDLPPDRQFDAIDERFPIIPGSPYGEGKFFIERMLHWFNRIYGLKYACLRYFNACGALPDRGEDHNPETHLIPLVLQVALGQRPHITIFGDDYPTRDGTCLRDYIHVIDLAHAHILVMEALDRLVTRQYNLGNGKGYTVKEVIEAARRVTGHPIPAIVGPRRPGDPAVLVASSETIRRELGWEPKYASLEAIIQSAWEWHRTHPRGYASLGK
ncbi:MAG: UDP-glucose 4-epimerase GalE [Chloroflexi bacterium]|uniref:UDP-glucose 4-epimerase n=1 Tax=Candidatus Thermofonsia Clade 3 bacterium TaxID=2364212 RepID=A0A2M8QCE5_9CHLR|nr:UDP-glucose 4-epimerase GalE [Candidatus Roseilinea sp. NK_OTU-006]PJF47485.1 MAG: UDP-glucose 4-epimerase GalE [Candidatus Thermofonsia Clade 3 bacterium]RMG64289.1 MAG: UDP-glucose 4-epimerase GalE [Chloroflexota bacterium]